MNHNTIFIPSRKKKGKKTKRGKNNISRPSNEPCDQFYTLQEKRRKNDNSRPANEPSDPIYSPRKKKKRKRTKERHLKTSK